MGRLGVKPSAVALVVVLLGQFLIVAGFAAVLGLAGGLFSAGIFLIVDGLLLVDVDKTARR